MGFFSKLKGKEDYPALASDSPVMNQVEEIEQPLQELMGQIKDPLEIVPAGDRTYIFIGKPPKRFGVAWIENGEIVNFQILAKEHGISPVEMQKISARLGSAYEQYQDAQRFKTDVSGRDIVVTPCQDLVKDVQQIITDVIS